MKIKFKINDNIMNQATPLLSHNPNLNCRGPNHNLTRNLSLNLTLTYP